MRNIFYIAGVLSLLLAACSEERERNDENAEARQLYAELCGVYRSYTDSLECASDTVSRLRIADALSESLRKIYAAHSPDLDRELTEGQNDTLWMLTSRYMKLRNDRLGAAMELPDTVEADSIDKNADIK